MTYHCAECGQPVTFEDGQIVRSCEHVEAGVIADVEATVYSQGSLA
jgi:hypothetical protein